MAGPANVKSAFESGDLVFRDKTTGTEIQRIAAGHTVQLTAGAVSTSAAGTISGTTSAGQSPTVTITDCTDVRGNFLLNPVTGGGSQTAGKVALVRYATALPAAPGAVTITVADETDSTSPITYGVLSADANGFDIYTSALTTGKAYRVHYSVRL